MAEINYQRQYDICNRHYSKKLQIDETYLQ
jgi:hypothetical protein